MGRTHRRHRRLKHSKGVVPLQSRTHEQNPPRTIHSVCVAQCPPQAYLSSNMEGWDKRMHSSGTIDFGEWLKFTVWSFEHEGSRWLDSTEQQVKDYQTRQHRMANLPAGYTDRARAVFKAIDVDGTNKINVPELDGLLGDGFRKRYLEATDDWHPPGGKTDGIVQWNEWPVGHERCDPPCPAPSHSPRAPRPPHPITQATLLCQGLW